jgi:hypothetical protein
MSVRLRCSCLYQFITMKSVIRTASVKLHWAEWCCITFHRSCDREVVVVSALLLREILLYLTNDVREIRGSQSHRKTVSLSLKVYNRESKGIYPGKSSLTSASAVNFPIFHVAYLTHPSYSKLPQCMEWIVAPEILRSSSQEFRFIYFLIGTQGPFLDFLILFRLYGAGVAQSV